LKQLTDSAETTSSGKEFQKLTILNPQTIIKSQEAQV